MKSPCVTTAQSTEIKLHCHCRCNAAREQTGGKREPSKVRKFQKGEETESNPHRAPSITNLVDFHEFGVGARPFYGHLDDVRGRRHCEPGECPRPVHRGSCSADGHTCLCLRRNDKEREKGTQCTCKADSAASLPVFTGGLGIRNGRAQKAQGANCTAAPEQTRRRRGRCRRPGVQAAGGHGPGGDSLLTLQGKRGAPHRGFCSPRTPGSERADSLRPERHRNPRAQRLRKDRLPRKSWSGSAVSSKCSLCVSQTEPCTIATRMSQGRGHGSRSTHRHTHTRSLPSAHQRKAPSPEDGGPAWRTDLGLSLDSTALLAQTRQDALPPPSRARLF